MRVVAKIGTASLTDAVGVIQQEMIDGVCDQLAALRAAGHEVLLVSSGAVSAGVAALGLPSRPTDVPTLQAISAAGQSRLMETYNRSLGRHGLVAAQVLLGALVAGIDAGRGYIDWPMMNGEFLPSESFDYEPFWSNFFENPALVQFNHRMLGYLVLLFTAYAWWRSRSSALRKTRRVFNWVAGLVVFQMLLGILTVLYAAPLQVAILHQIGAIIVVIAVLRARFAALYPAAQSLR